MLGDLMRQIWSLIIYIKTSRDDEASEECLTVYVSDHQVLQQTRFFFKPGNPNPNPGEGVFILITCGYMVTHHNVGFKKKKRVQNWARWWYQE